MSDRASHYAAADRLLDNATNGWSSPGDRDMLLAAIAHAILATVDLEVYDHVRRAERAMQQADE